MRETCSLMRHLCLPTGGYAGLQRVAQWNLDFMGKSDEGRAYMDLVGVSLVFLFCAMEPGSNSPMRHVHLLRPPAAICAYLIRLVLGLARAC